MRLLKMSTQKHNKYNEVDSKENVILLSLVWNSLLCFLLRCSFLKSQHVLPNHIMTKFGGNSSHFCWNKSSFFYHSLPLARSYFIFFLYLTPYSPFVTLSRNGRTSVLETIETFVTCLSCTRARCESVRW